MVTAHVVTLSCAPENAGLIDTLYIGPNLKAWAISVTPWRARLLFYEIHYLRLCRVPFGIGSHIASIHSYRDYKSRFYRVCVKLTDAPVILMSGP